VTVRYAEGSASLLELGSRLVADVRRLLEQHLELLKAELTQEVTRVAKAVGLLAAGAVGAGLGVVFLLVALGLWIGRLVASIPGGLAIVGAGLTVTGLVVGLLAVKALERQRLARATAGELRRDAEWIRNRV
jgi:uncharacterized membrane protein YqjE